MDTYMLSGYGYTHWCPYAMSLAPAQPAQTSSGNCATSQFIANNAPYKWATAAAPIATAMP